VAELEALSLSYDGWAAADRPHRFVSMKIFTAAGCCRSCQRLTHVELAELITGCQWLIRIVRRSPLDQPHLRPRDCIVPRSGHSVLTAEYHAYLKAGTASSSPAPDSCSDAGLASDLEESPELVTVRLARSVITHREGHNDSIFPNN